MTQRATLTASPSPHLPGHRLLTLDCAHGTTEAAYANGTAPDAYQLTDTAVVRVLLLRHYEAERCGCTLELRWQLGVGVGVID